MPYTKAELLAEITRVATELGHQPSLQDFREHGEVGVTTIYDRFGSWNDAIAAAGYEPQDAQSEIPRETLIESLQELAAELGERPSVTDVNEHGEYWASTYRNRFGSWNEALEAAGFEPRNQGVAISENNLRDELKRLAAELSRPPTFDEMAEKGEYSPSTYVRTFGSWTAAVVAVNLEPANTGSDVTDADLLAELRRLADELDRRPSSREMDERGAYATATYQRHFDSWSAAVNAALDDVERE